MSKATSKRYYNFIGSSNSSDEILTFTQMKRKKQLRKLLMYLQGKKGNGNGKR